MQGTEGGHGLPPTTYANAEVLVDTPTNTASNNIERF
jgi:hypothetical protein